MEFGLVLPLFMLFVFCVIQLGVIFIAYYSETRMARETARWLAVNANATDAQVAAQVQSTMLPGLINGSISGNYGDSNNAIYDVGAKMTVTFTSCGTTTPPCTNNNRAPGATLYVQMSYDVKYLLFLPTNFQLGNLQAHIPTGLPGYRVYVMVE